MREALWAHVIKHSVPSGGAVWGGLGSRGLLEEELSLEVGFESF